jgi:hypothetical protein
VETFHLPPGPGNGRTNTSCRPDSLDAYARNFPSGENAGSVSTCASARKGSAFRVAGPIHLPHAALADRGEELIGTKLRAGLE